MQKKTKSLFIITGFFFLLAGCQQKQISLSERLETLPNAEVKVIEHDSLFNSAYKIQLQQPLDHQEPEGKKFSQRIFLSHIDSTRPVVVITEGYTANRNYVTELARYLNANQIIIEHRYFGESVPDTIDWQYLNIKQAANDHHRVIELFKRVYPGKWITTGVSKGGQTVMYHSYFFPKDVDARVPYVAPLNFSEQDPRANNFLRSVGTDSCRRVIHNMQAYLLRNKNIYYPMFLEQSEEKGLRFNRVGGPDKGYEYCILEYPFAFWQYGNISCNQIPDTSSSDENIYKHFSNTTGFWFLSDQGIEALEPFYYQAMTEIGFYAYDLEEFKGLIEYVTNPVFTFAAPQGVELDYDYEIMKNVNKYISEKAGNFIFIYGENDAWFSTAVQLSGSTNSIKIIKPGGSHGTRIRNLPENLQDSVFTTLHQMLGVKITKAEEEL